jgi:two-component system response regulator DegU
MSRVYRARSSTQAISGTTVLASCPEPTVKMLYGERFSKRMKLRVVVADDSASFLDKLVSILEIEFDMVQTVMDGKSALDIIVKCRPDVVVLDLEMRGLNGIEVTRELMKYDPRPAIVICSLEKNREVVDAALKAGALGYVFKARATRDLIAAVKLAALGVSYASPD